LRKEVRRERFSRKTFGLCALLLPVLTMLLEQFVHNKSYKNCLVCFCYSGHLSIGIQSFFLGPMVAVQGHGEYKNGIKIG